VVHMDVQPTVQVPDDSSVMVTSAGLLGSSYIAIQPGGSDRMLASRRREIKMPRAPST